MYMKSESIWRNVKIVWELSTLAKASNGAKTLEPKRKIDLDANIK